MLVRRRLYAAVGFGYLGSISLLVAVLVGLGCLLDRLDRSKRVGSRYDGALVAALVWVLRPIDLIPVALGSSRPATESGAPADDPA